MYEWPRTAEPGNPEICIVSFFCHVLSLFCRLGVSFVIFLSFGCVMCVCHVSVSLACSKCGFPTRTRNYRTMLKWQKTQGKARFLTLSSSAANAGHQKKQKSQYIYITEKWQKITKKRYVAMPKNDKNMVWSDISTMTPSVNLSRYNPTEPLSGGQFLQVRKGHLCWIPTFNQGLPVQPPYFMV